MTHRRALKGSSKYNQRFITVRKVVANTNPCNVFSLNIYQPSKSPLSGAEDLNRLNEVIMVVWIKAKSLLCQSGHLISFHC